MNEVWNSRNCIGVRTLSEDIIDHAERYVSRCCSDLVLKKRITFMMEHGFVNCLTTCPNYFSEDCNILFFHVSVTVWCSARLNLNSWRCFGGTGRTLKLWILSNFRCLFWKSTRLQRLILRTGIKSFIMIKYWLLLSSKIVLIARKQKEDIAVRKNAFFSHS